MKRISLAIAAIFISLSVFAQSDIVKLETSIRYLSSDKLKGRFPGTKGEKKAAKYIQKEFEKLGLQPMGTNGYVQEFAFSYSDNPHGGDGKNAIHSKGKNIIAYLDNNAEYTIVIGAHYDHLGLGHVGSLTGTQQIHNGADDNASGTAGVIELARYLRINPIKENHNFLFICFSAEEEGLLGSKYFTNNPTVPLDKINMMINMDMIGRLNDSTKRLSIMGTGTSSAFEPLIEKIDAKSLVIKTDSSGMGPSDHASFYLKNIPVLHFFTGVHPDYHKPSDDADKINYTGVGQVLDYMIQFIHAIDKENKLVFQPTKSKTSTTNIGFKVTLGVIPDYSYDGTGLRLDGISEGKAAQAAGLKTGDIILKIGDLEITNIQDYMKALNVHKKGDRVIILVKRGDKEERFEAIF